MFPSRRNREVVRKAPRSRPRLEELERRDLLSTSIPLNADSWTALGPGPLLHGQTPGHTPVSGRIAAVASDPNDADTLYVAAAGGGVWKTTDGGQDWTPLTDDQPTLFMGAIAVAPGDSNVVYAGTGEATNSISSFYGRGVLKSTDAGRSWTLLGNDLFDRRTVSQIAISPPDPDTVYVAVAGGGTNGIGTNTGVYRSTDGGQSWVNTTAGINTTVAWSDLVMDPTDPLTLYAAAGTIGGAATNGVYKTTDGGDTWAPAGNFQRGRINGNIKIALAASSPNVLYASVAGSGVVGSAPLGALFRMEKSTDGGQTWSLLPGVPNYMGNQGWYDSTLAADPSDPDVAFAAGQRGDESVLETTDGGATWNPIAAGADGNGPHNDHHGIGFDAQGRLLDGTDGGIWRLDVADVSNITWTDLNGNLQLTQYIGVALDPGTADVAYGGSQDNGISKFTDDLAWTQVQEKDGGFVRVDRQNPQTVYHTFEYLRGETAEMFLERSDDGGATWTPMVNGIDVTQNGAFYPPFVMDPANSNRLLVGLSRVYVTTDRGENWVPISPGGGTIDAIATADADTIYYASGSQIFVTFDGGQTWTPHTVPGFAGHFQDVRIDPADPLTAYVVRDRFGGQVFKTTDGGATWANISNDLPDLPAYTLVIDPRNGNLYLGNDDGVYVSADGGGSWARFGAALPHAQVHDLELDPGLEILAAGTHGRGLWEINVPGQRHAAAGRGRFASALGLAQALRPVTAGGLGRPTGWTGATSRAGAEGEAINPWNFETGPASPGHAAEQGGVAPRHAGRPTSPGYEVLWGDWPGSVGEPGEW